MKHEHHLLFALLVAAPAAFAANPPGAFPAATSQLSPVTVSGPSLTTPALRFDVRAECPTIDAALQKSLASAWGRVQEPATLRVQFRLVEGRVTDVQSTGSNRDYRPFVRRAVEQLDCASSGAEVQAFAFILDIVSPDPAASQERAAVLSARR